MAVDDLTKDLTVGINQRTEAAPHAAASLTGDTLTDVVNRAVQAYALLAEVATHQGNYRVQFDVGEVRLYALAGRTPHRRRFPWPW